MSEIYKSLSDARKLVSVGDQDYEIKTQSHSLKDLGEINPSKPPRVLRIYSDGSSLVSKNNTTNPTYSGWGFFITGFQNGSIKNLRRNHGFLLDGTPLLAELEAIKKGLEYVNKPSCVSLVTDSTDAIKELKNLDSIDSRMKELKKSGINRRENHVQFRILRVLGKIKELAQSNNISALEVTWQPSHTMDRADVEIDDLRNAMMEEDDITKKLFLMDVYGNEMADLQAGKGSKKAVKIAMDEISKNEHKLKELGMMKVSADFLARKAIPDDIIREYGKAAFDTLMKYGKDLRQSTRLLHGSRTAKTVAIELFGEHPRDYVTDQVRNALFTREDQEKIDQLIRKNFPDEENDKSRSKIMDVAEKVENSGNSESNCLIYRIKPEDWAKGKITFKEYKSGTGYGESILNIN